VNRRWFAVAALMVALSGCQLTSRANADPVEAVADQPFTLHGGQEAVISDQDMRVRFDNVLEDSRCPTEVECVWTGEARIAVSVRLGDADPAAVEFNTNPAPKQTRSSVVVGAYTIELQSLEPIPRMPGESIPLEDYTATLIVHTP
jgi:hypothetical protein